MGAFQYLILSGRDNPSNPGQVFWTPFPPVPGVAPNFDLGRMLNALGAKGWEVVTAVDAGGSSRSEIILKLSQ